MFFGTTEQEEATWLKTPREIATSLGGAVLSSEDAVPFQSSGSLAFKETALETTELV